MPGWCPWQVETAQWKERGVGDAAGREGAAGRGSHSLLAWWATLWTLVWSSLAFLSLLVMAYEPQDSSKSSFLGGLSLIWLIV